MWEPRAQPLLSRKKAESEVAINQQAVEADRRLNGKCVLATNTNLSLAELAKTYKGLPRVEPTSREEKSTLEGRPIYQQRDDTRLGHIVASFLDLRLKVDLQARLADKRVETLWPDLMRDLKEIHAIRMTLDETPYLIRADFQGVAYQPLNVARVRPPSRVMRLDGAAHPIGS
jgi:hypothetical protein